MDWARRIELVSVLIASFVAVGGLWYSSVQTRQANDQARQASEQARQDRALVKEGQVTDRYTAAVTNLGDDKMDVRLGGIYALQRIMQDSTRDQPTIANVLATYIRAHAAKRPTKDQGVPADVQAALAVLTARDTTHDKNFTLDLRNTWLPEIEIGSQSTHASANAGSLCADWDNVNLSGARLDGAHLSGTALTCTDLSDASLDGADLSDASLDGADLSDASLDGADLSDADLFDADLSGAHMVGVDLSATLSGADLSDAALFDADLSGAILNSTDLSDAILSGADLRGADLGNAKNLSKRQLDSAKTDRETKLPAGF